MTHRFDTVMADAKAGLSGMIRRRDPAGIAGLRSIIAALENACALPIADPVAEAEEGVDERSEEHIAGAVGFGRAEAARRDLTADEVDQILNQEIAERQDQAEFFDKAGRDLESAMATYQAKLITRLRDGELLRL